MKKFDYRVIRKFDPCVIRKFDPAIAMIFDPAVAMIFDPAVAMIFDPAVAMIFDPAVVMIFDPADNDRFDHAVIKEIRPDSFTPVEPKTSPDTLRPLGANTSTIFLTGTKFIASTFKHSVEDKSTVSNTVGPATQLYALC
jgi:hypothetical protein